jgi:RNA polymerase sigma factor (sigma-70 family)
MTSTESKPSQPAAEQKFGEEVSDLLHPYNPQGTTLRRFIRRQIQQWHLNSFDAEDVLQEAILQGLRYTRKTGKEIHNPTAWLRVTTLRILQNGVRQTIRKEQLPENLKLINPANSDDPALQLELKDSLNQLAIARQNLSDEDQEILTLYFDQDKTYEQIQAYYERKDNEWINLPTIRKRVSRAKDRAFKAFQEINGSPSQTEHNLGHNSERLSVRRTNQVEK